MADTNGGVLANAVKIVGEAAFAPGLSLAVDGDVKGGALHLGAAIAAGMLLGPVLGPIGWFAAGLDSYSQSVSGKHIHEHFKKSK